MGKSTDKAVNLKKHNGRKKKKDTADTEAKEPLKENGVDPEPVKSDEFVPPDGGWGWVVCFASLWTNGTVFGIINTFGIVYVRMREIYAKDDPAVSVKTAFVGSVCTGVTFLMCIAASICSDRFGIRPTAVTGAALGCIGLVASAFIEQMEILYLTFGVILGLGSALCYNPSLVILGHYFKKHMGLVNGIVAFGSAIFTIALTRILPVLLEKTEIKYTFIFLAGLDFVALILAFSWKPIYRKPTNIAALTLSTESVYEHCNTCCSWTKKFLNVKIWRNRAYVIWIVSLCIALFGYFVPFFHLPQYIRDNFPGEDGSLLILCLSITSGVSRILFGKLADFQCVSRIRMQQLSFVVLGISTLCIPFSASFGGLIAISLVMGICDGIIVCLLGPIAFDIVGPAEASQAIGFLLGIFSIPFTIGPPVAGWLYDFTGGYRIAFHAAGAPPILGAIIMFLIPKVQQNYPAVTEVEEFASVSMMDVYNVSSNNVTRAYGSNPRIKVPSGPATEVELIQSTEVLYLGKWRRQKSVEVTVDEEADAKGSNKDGLLHSDTNLPKHSEITEVDERQHSSPLVQNGGVGVQTAENGTERSTDKDEEGSGDESSKSLLADVLDAIIVPESEETDL